MEQNKTGKYFKYAIGEIILVVIGILIALSINNWNEGRKSENNKQILMLALKQEFLTNKKALERQLLGLHKNNSQLNKVINFSAGALDLPIDSLRLYASQLFYPITLSMLSAVQEEAISAGKFELLSDSLKLKLSLLKDFSKSRKDINNNMDQFTFKYDSEVSDLILNLSAFREVIEELYVQPPTTMHPDFIKSDDQLISLIKSSKTYAILNQIYYLSELDEVWIKYGLLRLTNETIYLIDKEIKE
jgi:hypothetical protein